MNKKLHVYGGIARYNTSGPAPLVGGAAQAWAFVRGEQMTFDAIEATTAKYAARAMLNLVKLSEAKAFSITIEITHRDGKPYTGFQPKRWST